MKKNSGVLIVLVLIVAALFALNPSKEDFSNYRRDLTAKAVEDAGGAIKALAGAISGGLSDALYSRANYGVFSVFYTGARDNMSNRYLGVAKMFIKLDE